MNHKEACASLVAAKKSKGVTFEQIGAAIGCHKVFVASVFHGQNSLGADQAEKLVAFLGASPDAAKALQECPMKGGEIEKVPVDPLIYRFYEIMQVYGTSMKDVIHEQFGDGIMSAIDFTLDVQKQSDPKGDRVVVTMNGKFLPYKKW